MKKINKILVPYDFSEYSKESLEYAVKLADDLKAGIIIANIINARDLNTIRMAANFTGAISSDDFIKHKMENRLERINKMVEEISASHLSIKIVIKTGIPFCTLIQAVKDEGADIVIMGSKGRSNIQNILFGSTAEKMFRHCPVPLLSIRSNMNR